VREQVLHFIRERRLLKAGDRVAVAVSGGADSVALLRVLLELRNELGVVLFVAHFNHQLRGEESDADERFVAELSRQLDVPFFAGRGDVRGLAEEYGVSVEEAARDYRYGWLSTLDDKESFDAVATGHTADDQAETVLMKFLRGAGTRGFAGIHPVQRDLGVNIVRPLLNIARTEIDRYLRQLNQAWREDHTNSDNTFTRNKIRHELLPLLEREHNPNLREVLCENAEIAREEEEYWGVHIAELIGPWRVVSRRMPLRARDGSESGFLFAHCAEQRRVVKSFLERHDIAVDFEHVEAVRKCAVGDGPPISLSGGWRAHREDNWLRLTPPPTPASASPPGGYLNVLTVPGECWVNEAAMTVRATIVSADAAGCEPPGTLLQAKILPDELSVRNWLPGDKYRPAYRGAEEKLKRLFAEKHIPADERPLWPVVLAGHQIVWVRGFPVNHHFVWKPGSGNALRIEVLPSDPPSGTSLPETASK
jgi:tRNA(Ile)-lysidine synthase